MYLKTIIMIAMLGLASVSQAAERFAAAKAGIWHGVGVQIDAQEWWVELTVREDRANVEYGPPECHGEWQYLRVGLAEFLAVEHITVGTDICIDGGVVELMQHDDNTLYALWFDSDGEFLAGAVLFEGEMQHDNYEDLRFQTLSVVMGYVVGPMNADVNLKENKI